MSCSGPEEKSNWQQTKGIREGLSVVALRWLPVKEPPACLGCKNTKDTNEPPQRSPRQHINCGRRCCFIICPSPFLFSNFTNIGNSDGSICQDGRQPQANITGVAAAAYCNRAELTASCCTSPLVKANQCDFKSFTVIIIINK